MTQSVPPGPGQNLRVIAGFTDQDKQVTVVFDKGMNSMENIATINGHQHIHFVTTYSLY